MRQERKGQTILILRRNACKPLGPLGPASAGLGRKGAPAGSGAGGKDDGAELQANEIEGG